MHMLDTLMEDEPLTDLEIQILYSYTISNLSVQPMQTPTLD